MSRLRFKRPAGAGADVKELEYVIALHQTSEETRTNATISSMDIVALLRSRYSLTITNEQAINLVRSLGGGDTAVNYFIDSDEVIRSSNGEGSSSATHGNVLQKAVGGIHSILHSKKHSHIAKDHTILPGHGPQENSEASSFTNATRRLRDLHALHAMNRVGQCDTHRMLAARDNVTALLRAKIVEKTKSMRHVAAFPSDDRGDDDDVAISNSMKNRERVGVEPHNVSKPEEVLGSTHSMAGTSYEFDTRDEGGDDLEGRPGDDAIMDVEKEHLVGGMHPEQELATVHEDDVESLPIHGDSLTRDVEKADGTAPLKSSEVDLPDLGDVEEGAQHVKSSTRNVENASTVQSSELDRTNVVNNGTGGSRAKKSVSYQDANDDVEDKPDLRLDIFYDDDGEPLPEFLDLVQVMSTLLIPKFASLCYEATNRVTQDSDVTKDALVEEEVRCFLNRLKKGFVAYGRRKLKIPDEPPLQPAHNVLETGRRALLAAVADDEDPVLDETLVQLLLIANGEIERANDVDLVKEMVQVAQSASGRFDEASLVRAISSDLASWDPTCQNTPTTFFYDVFGVAHPSSDTRLENEKHPDRKNGESASRNSNHHGSSSVFRTAFLGIDLFADGFASNFMQLLIWTTFAFTAVLYTSMFLRSRVIGDHICPSSQYGCMVGNSVYSWITNACVVVGTGVVFIIPVSVGNSPADRSARKQIFACGAMLINSVVPFVVVRWLQRKEDELNPGFFAPLQDEEMALWTLTMGMGLVVALVFALQGLAVAFVDREKFQKAPRPFPFCLSGAPERRLYCATKFKIGKILSNALSLHRFDELDLLSASIQKKHLATRIALAATRDGVSRNFLAHGETYEEAGGVLWTFWKLCDGSLFRQEGIWLNSRLLLIQVNQVLVGIALMFFYLLIASVLADKADSERAAIVRKHADKLGPDLLEWVLDIIPTGKMIRQSLIPAAYVAMVVMIGTIVIYIPSSVSTVMSYRGQLRPSLGSGYFQKFREDVDLVYTNTTNALYGFAGAASIFYGFVGVVLFLFVWPISKRRILWMSAWGIGLGITMLVTVVITTVCRQFQYRGYYRMRPAAARVTSVALESWFLGLGLSVFLARITQCLIAVVLWIGRIDVPILSEDVHLFTYNFDRVPIHFVKDLLVHEAHRHPYIEQLTQMYLMKLRHGDRFVSDACTVWRQLLVVALMPWLGKYRIFNAERRATAEMEVSEETHSTPTNGGTETGHVVINEVAKDIFTDVEEPSNSDDVASASRETKVGRDLLPTTTRIDEVSVPSKTK